MIRMQVFKSKAFSAKSLINKASQANSLKNQPKESPMEVILATKSPYKQAQLKQLGLNFESVAPEYREEHKAESDPEALSVYLATQKARSLSDTYPEAVIIGSDQTAIDPNGLLLTKPVTAENAFLQLKSCSGQRATFYSAFCVLCNNKEIALTIPTHVIFRHLSDEEINRYIRRDNPLDCAGSFKMESLGISLFERIESKDPTALIGLPLIQLSKVLRETGLTIP